MQTLQLMPKKHEGFVNCVSERHLGATDTPTGGFEWCC